MSEPWHFESPATWKLVDLARLYTRCFANYFYDCLVTPEDLAERIASEDLDLDRSSVLFVGDRPAGLALLGLRRAEAVCGGFGIVPEHRGRGWSHHLIRKHVEEARAAGVSAMG